jgi:hypothetical protein
MYSIQYTSHGCMMISMIYVVPLIHGDSANPHCGNPFVTPQQSGGNRNWGSWLSRYNRIYLCIYRLINFNIDCA